MGALAPGTVLGGCRIDAVVGRGGMGVVYRARQLDLDRDVALKVIAPELVEDPEIRRRFLSEARAAGAVEHPNVVPVHAVGVADERAYLVMRYVPGDDLRAVVLREGALDPRRAAGIAAALGGALDAIHRAGYVHRDVKPKNVIIDGAGHVYLSDFGLAKQALATAGPTRPEQWVGTLDYAAPEQIRGERVDARADVYALGAVLYFMLTARVPFERESDHAKLWAHLSDPPPRASDVRPELPAELDAVIARAMAKDPAERPPSAGDLGRAVGAATGVRRETGPERIVARGAAAPATTVVARSRVELARPRRRALPLVAASGSIAAAVVALVLLRGGDAPDRRTGAVGVIPATATPTATPTESPHRGGTTQNVGFRPRGVVVARGRVWVISSHEGRIAAIDVESGAPRGRQQWIGHGATGIARDGDTIWVAGPPRGAVMGISARTGRMIRFLKVAVPPVRVAAGPTGLWVVSRAELVGPATLYRYDREGGQLIGQLDFPAGISAITLGGGHAWIAPRDEQRVVKVAPDLTNETAGWLTAPASELAYGAGYVWASVQPDDSVAQIDPRTNGTITTRVARHPEQLVVARHRVFVASSTDHRIVMLSPRTGDRVGALRVPRNPYGVAAGEGHVWVTGLGKSTLTRLDF
jgi:hypothetical protein